MLLLAHPVVVLHHKTRCGSKFVLVKCDTCLDPLLSTYNIHPKNRDHVLLSLLSLPLIPIFKSINNSRMCNNTPNIKTLLEATKGNPKKRRRHRY
jgi:hypothetical protein